MNNPILGMVSMAVALVALIVAGVCNVIIPQYPLVWQIGLGVAAAGVIAYIVFDLKSLSELFSRRTTRFGLLAMVVSIVAVGMTIFSNLIVANHDWRKDYTADKIHSLSDQTKKVLSNLKTNIEVKAFVPGDHKAGYEEFFSKYRYNTDKLKIDYIDTFREPLLVRQYKIMGEGRDFSTIILEAEGRTARVESITGPNDPRLEEKMTNGIIKVLKGGQRKVYFLAGHVEKSLTKNTPEGLSSLKTAMEGSRFATEELSLIQKGGIPADAEIVVIAGPKSQFFPEELKQLGAFLEKGGSILLMLDPDSSPDLKEFLAKYGVEWTPKTAVFEENPYKMVGNAPHIPRIDVYNASHPITKDFYAPTFFALATSVDKAKNAPVDENIASLFSTSQFSFEEELKPGAKIGRMFATRSGKPLSLAVAVSGKAKAVEEKKPEAKKDEKKDEKKEAAKEPEKSKGFRMVVVGDSDFVANGALAQGVNSDLFLNMMSWLADEEDLISIRPKTATVRELEMTDGRFRLAILVTFLLLPASAITTAFAVRRNRRRR